MLVLRCLVCVYVCVCRRGPNGYRLHSGVGWFRHNAGVWPRVDLTPAVDFPSRKLLDLLGESVWHHFLIWVESSPVLMTEIGILEI